MAEAKPEDPEVFLGPQQRKCPSSVQDITALSRYLCCPNGNRHSVLLQVLCGHCLTEREQSGFSVKETDHELLCQGND